MQYKHSEQLFKVEIATLNTFGLYSVKNMNQPLLTYVYKACTYITKYMNLGGGAVDTSVGLASGWLVVRIPTLTDPNRANR